MSTRNGALPYSVGAQGVKARDRPLLFGGHLLHMPEAIDWWDACAEGLHLAVVTLDRICQLLFHNFGEFAHLAGYQRLAASVVAIVRYARESLPEVSALQGHCRRLLDVMTGLTSAIEQLEEEPQELPEGSLYEIVEDTSRGGGGGGAAEPAAEGSAAAAGGEGGEGGGAAGMRGAGEAAGPQGRRKLMDIVRRPGADGDGGGAEGGTGGGASASARPAAPAAAGGSMRAAPPPPAGAAAGASPARPGLPPRGPAPPPPAGATAAGAAVANDVAAQQSGVKKERSSNVLKSGSKGLRNMLGLRKRGGKPEMANIHKMHAADQPGENGEAAAQQDGATAAPAANGAAAAAARSDGAAAPADGTAAPAQGAGARSRHVFRSAPEAQAAAGAAAGADARRAPPPRPQAGVPASAVLPSVAPLAPPAPQAPARVRYIGPTLAPLAPGLPPREGFPFGAPTSVTLGDSVRAKRHIVFESQLTSSQQQIWEAYRDPSERPDNSHTLADLLATIGTMPSPMQLARSIDPASVLNDVGSAVHAVPGRFVEVTSGHEAIRLFARVTMDWPALQLAVTFRAQSMLEVDLTNISVRVQLLGAAAWVGMAGWTLHTLGAREAATHRLILAVSGSGALVLQPTITHRLPTTGGEGVDRLEVVTAPLRVPITLQLKAPRVPLPAATFFQRFHTWHYSCCVTGAHLLLFCASVCTTMCSRSLCQVLQTVVHSYSPGCGKRRASGNTSLCMALSAL